MSEQGAITLLRSMRVPFLVLAPVCVFLGIATALQAGFEVRVQEVLLVTLGAVSAHVSVNTFNEYFDFRSGLDAMTTRTPFSGGSGALVERPQAARAVLYLAVLSLALTIGTGVYFILRHGPWLLLPGMAGILIILAYTGWLTRRPLLCLVAPGTGFGPVMAGGTHLALTGTYPAAVLLVALVPFFLTNNLLLLNQLPDLDADRRAGRRHFPIVFGVTRSIQVYGLFTLATGVALVTGIRLGYIPQLGYICLAPLAVAVAAWAGAGRHAGHTERLLPYLGMNVLAAVATPLLLGVALIMG